jgi:hypothetical protein
MNEIRSYRRVFNLERRLYSIDRVRLNPGGVPLRGVAYAFAAVIASVATRRLPVLGALAAFFPWYISELACPLIAASLFSMLRIDGRRFHLVAIAAARHSIGPKRLAGMRSVSATGSMWWPADLVVVPDGSEGRMRRIRFCGPGALFVACPYQTMAERSIRRARGMLRVRECSQEGHTCPVAVLVLRPGSRLVVDPRAGA